LKVSFGEIIVLLMNIMSENQLKYKLNNIIKKLLWYVYKFINFYDEYFKPIVIILLS